ncbi:MAG TPA: ATPase, T2SS/T4P/T4SS family, partial [Candidatus Obscuribacter sp.]|nr:ATPase, T2SS/T4P/T4SS family [Candidatus Obscuribacter sp.]
VTKAIQQKWSDIHLEPEQSAMSLRYFKSGEVLADCKLPIQINQPLAGSYKRMVGLDAAESKRPQDKKQSLNIAETDIELRVTTMPSEFGEMIAISIRYLT